jgi:hypothetical protein
MGAVGSGSTVERIYLSAVRRLNSGVCEAESVYDYESIFEPVLTTGRESVMNNLRGFDHPKQ